MTLVDQMLDDVSNVFLNTDEHAQTAVRTPNRGGGTTTFTAVVDVLETTLDESKGKRVIHHASLLCASSVVIEVEDMIATGGIDWIVDKTGPASVGMKTYMLTRTDKRSSQAAEATFK